jgi:hypothetical protein
MLLSEFQIGALFFVPVALITSFVLTFSVKYDFYLGLAEQVRKQHLER